MGEAPCGRHTSHRAEPVAWWRSPLYPRLLTSGETGPECDKPSLHPIIGDYADRRMARRDAARKRVSKISNRVANVSLCYQVGDDSFWLAQFQSLLRKY